MKTSKPNEITFVLGGLVGGGAERVASHLINYWVEQGWHINLVTRLHSEEDFYTISPKVTRQFLGDGGRSSNKIIALFKNIPVVWKLRKAIKKAGSPIVISFLTKANIHTILACAGLNKHVIISERNDTTRENHSWPWPQLRKLCYKYATVVTANSQVAIEGMSPYVPEQKLHFIPNPVVVPEISARPGLSTEILNVGRLVPQKRQDLLIDAFAKIDRSFQKKWTLNILGEGTEKQSLIYKINKLQVKDRIELPGVSKNPEKYYMSAGIFVLPSDFEGTPNALLEAMAHGLPCIVSDSIEGAQLYIEHEVNGLYFKSGNAVDLVNKLTKLIKSPGLRDEFGAKSKQKMKLHSIENINKQWANLFDTSRIKKASL